MASVRSVESVLKGIAETAENIVTIKIITVFGIGHFWAPAMKIK